MRVGLAARGGRLRNSVLDFGNESMVVDEGVIGERLRSADSESDEYQRDPLVEFLNHAGLAENHFVQDDVVSVAVAVVQHGAPRGFVDQVLWMFRSEDQKRTLVRSLWFTR
jgi:hypothetical protein